jgi:uncharacterized damage-inducible protein DinB
MEVADLIRYNLIIHGLYLEALAKLPWEAVVEPRGLSFDSMRNVFLHLTLVEDRWIGYTIVERFDSWKDPDFEAFKNMTALDKYMRKVHSNTASYLEKLNPQELSRQIMVSWVKNWDTKITVEKGLTHMVLEDMIHYGELSTVLSQMGLEAPYSGFWRFGLEV